MGRRPPDRGQDGLVRGRRLSADPVSIVLVDDAPDVRALLRTRLRLTKRFDIVGEGGTGGEAIRLVMEHSPQLILLDVSMPDMDGLDALARIVESSPATKVVMFSGFEEHGLADRALELGAADFIEKSMPVERLVDRLVDIAGAGDGRPPRMDVPRAEPILEEHLERFRAAFDQAAIGMATLTLTGRIIRANGALEQLCGVGDAGLVGRLYATLVAGPQREVLEEMLEQVAAGSRDAATIEHGLRDRFVTATLASVRDSTRKPLYLFAQVQDLTERRLAEEELRRSEERFRLLVESVGDYAIFMLDPTGHIVSWNIGAQRAKGYTAEEIVGKHFSTFYTQEAIDRDHPAYELEIASREGRYEEEGWRVRKDGTQFWANVVITAVRDRAGELVGFAKVTRDITERRRLLSDLEAAAAARTQLLAVTAHELRTPVAVVKGFGSTLHDLWDELEDAERREMAASLARSGERLSRLVEDLFTAARLESGALEIRREMFELGEVAEEAVRDASAMGAEVRIEPVRVLADRGRVHQMLSNYLTNALKYGRPPIVVEVRAAADSASVEVCDSGPGVAPELVPMLFSKFAAGGSKEGTGLGLFIVRELARAQDGDAWYEPGPDGGARFGMRLPRAG